MISFFCICNALVSLWTLFICIRALKTGRPMLLPIYLLIYTATNSLGLSVAFIPEFNRDIWYGMYDAMVRDEDFAAISISTWIFLVPGGLLTLFRSRHLPGRAISLKLGREPAIAACLLLFLLGNLLYLRFMFFGPGLQLAFTTNFFQYDIANSYLMRTDIEEYVGVGQGLLMATVASFVVFPLSTFFATLTQRASLFVPVIASVSFLYSIIFTFALRQKAPVLLVTILYGLMLLHHTRNSIISILMRRLSNWRMVAAACVALFAALSFFYQITEGDGPAESVGHSFFRLFMIPVASNQAWFLLFPDVLTYRGLIGVFDTLFWSNGAFPIGVFDVSHAITGYRFSLNASMLAVAWSADGYLGVIAICVLFHSLSYLIDYFLVRIDPLVAMPLIYLSIPSMLSLTSTSFFDFVMKGGFVNQLLVIFVYNVLAKRFKQSGPAVRQQGNPQSLGFVNPVTVYGGQPPK